MRKTPLLSLLLLPLPLAAPALAADRSVYVSQIGDANRADIRQTATAATGIVTQAGSRNTAALRQDGRAASYAELHQTGSHNDIDAAQKGASGADVLHVVQSGTDNVAGIGQTATGASPNTAMLEQLGRGNQAVLTQQGQGNQAILTQLGDDNAMTATQLGVGNRLTWTQIGDHNPDLGITERGGQTLTITQSR